MRIQQNSSNVTLVYNHVEQRTSVTYPNTNSVTYAYNATSELTSLTYKQGATTLGDLTYTYDAAGKRIKTGGTFARSNIPPVLTTTSYNANNQQTTFGTTTETYDLIGNLATSTDAGVTTTYTWNARNQLTGISRTGLTASFTYDSFGRRTGRTVNGVVTNYVYDGLNPVQEKNGGTVTANLLTGLGIDEFFTRTDGVGSRALLPDSLGSTVALGDGTGALQTQYTYEPFGLTTQTGSANTNSYKYTGREEDGTGLMYYRARYYHPRLQRLISEDPIVFGGGDINLYGYVWENPLNYVDPSGYTAAAGAIAGAAMSGPPGAVIGAAIGAIGTAGVAWWILHSNPSADDPAVYPDNPKTAPEKFKKIRKSKGKQCIDDGSVWEPDTSGHGGDQWKRWPDKGSWEKGETPTSVWPDGRIRK
ncbi:MAG: RHS repeat-associated core domain-containing protein [Nitrospira sp.]